MRSTVLIYNQSIKVILNYHFNYEEKGYEKGLIQKK